MEYLIRFLEQKFKTSEKNYGFVFKYGTKRGLQQYGEGMAMGLQRYKMGTLTEQFIVWRIKKSEPSQLL